MIYFIITILLSGLFMYLYKKEKRRFYNAIILFIAVAMLCVSIAEYAYQHNMPVLSEIMFLLIFAFIPLSIAGLCVLLLIDTFILLKREGKRPKNLLPFFFALFLIGGTVSVFYALMGISKYIFMNYIIVTIGGLTLYFGLIFASFLVYTIIYASTPKKIDAKYIIIHGAGLLGGDRPTPLLEGRIKKGKELYDKAKNGAKLIASGGKGADEKISEAEAIARYLETLGISSEDIIKEDKSTTTHENLKFSKEIIEQREGKTPCKCFFVTSDYHVLRTSFYARELGLLGEGVGSRTKWYYWITAFIREYIAIVFKYKWWAVGVIVVLVIISVYSMLPM